MDRRSVVSALALLSALAGAPVHAQVVSDSACPKHAVDIASFATCDGDQVAAPGRFELRHALLAEARVPAAKRTSLGLYVDARNAH